MYHMVHSGPLRILSCGLYHFCVYIISLNIHCDRIVHHLRGFVDGVIPAFSRYQVFQFSDKRSVQPGAIPAAIIAASIGNVPLPQKDPQRILSFFQGVSIISAAASVSVIGALLACCL